MKSHDLQVYFGVYILEYFQINRNDQKSMNIHEEKHSHKMHEVCRYLSTIIMAIIFILSALHVCSTGIHTLYDSIPVIRIHAMQHFQFCRISLIERLGIQSVIFLTLSSTDVIVFAYL